MTDEPIKPALTAEEWAALDLRLAYNEFDPQDELIASLSRNLFEVDGWELTPDRRHALAALALHGQPFGFTREELALMRFLAQQTHGADVEWGDEMVPLAQAIAAKIAALLPPSDAGAP